MKSTSKYTQALTLAALLGTNICVQAEEQENFDSTIPEQTLVETAIEKDTPEQEIIDLNVIEQTVIEETELTSKGSIYINEAEKDATLIPGNIPVLFIDSLEENKIILCNHNKPAGINKTFILSPSFPEPVVTREITNFFRAAKFSDKKFVPERIGGQVLKKVMEALLLLPDYQYKGMPVIDQANSGHAIRVNLAANEATQFVAYLKNNEKLLTIDAQAKPLIFFKSPVFTSLSTDDQSFINKYFTVDSSYEVQEFFVENQKQMDEENVVTDHNSKTASEYIYHEILKTCDDFKSEKLIAKFFSREIIQFAAGYASVRLIEKYGIPAVKERFIPALEKSFKRVTAN